ncbi:MAG TPA: acetyl-CoA carboxylase biotin carboxyl carrier protein subunit [Bdellovibrionales bacterium]|nr:acetyl-CoA carboxylase biotin carboxyl carrier protein subunit [Bdellovibrionales bacterium]
MKFIELELDGQLIRAHFETIDGRLWVHARGLTWEHKPAEKTKKTSRGHSGPSRGGDVHAPMPGKLVKINVKPGETVEAHQVVAIMEAMKMEYTLKSAAAGTVKEIRKTEGSQVALDEVLIVIETAGEAGAATKDESAT